MSQQKDLLREMAAAHNSGTSDRISDWFTENFRLHEPGAPPLPSGHEGASQMRARFRTLTSPINLEILDMIEEGDRVAVRWQLTATHHGKPFEQSIIAIYRFENGPSLRIGVSRSARFGRKRRAGLKRLVLSTSFYYGNLLSLGPVRLRSRPRRRRGPRLQSHDLKAGCAPA